MSETAKVLENKHRSDPSYWRLSRIFNVIWLCSVCTASPHCCPKYWFKPFQYPHILRTSLFAAHVFLKMLRMTHHLSLRLLTSNTMKQNYRSELDVWRNSLSTQPSHFVWCTCNHSQLVCGVRKSRQSYKCVYNKALHITEKKTAEKYCMFVSCMHKVNLFFLQCLDIGISTITDVQLLERLAVQFLL